MYHFWEKNVEKIENKSTFQIAPFSHKEMLFYFSLSENFKLQSGFEEFIDEDGMKLLLRAGAGEMDGRQGIQYSTFNLKK